MSFIRTVLGDIAPEELGVCYSHEHIIIDPSFATENEPGFLLDDVEKAVAELKELKALGVGAVVDSMPTGCGRNLEKLAEVSRQSEVHIIAPTGLHLAKYYAQEDNAEWEAMDAQELALMFDLAIFPHLNSSTVLNGGIPCGLIKIAALEDWDERTETLFQAAAIAQTNTGAPILTHTENGELALEQALFLREHGADLNHVVLSHLDRNLNANYQREVLRTGVTIEYDSHFRWKNKHPNPTLELLKQLLPEFPDQIVLGMDAARRSYWKSYGGEPGLGYLYGDFKNQMLDAGIDGGLIYRVFFTTPARVYSFKEKS
ncbi:phospho-furanose lactonase [Abditibacteriota bacterium]|nr:phospho-furanose lactonase [Abditibacteriota bacterium]